MPDPGDSIQPHLARLDPLDRKHIEIGLVMTEAYGGVIYGIDLLAYGALNRSKAHLVGFKELIRLRNMICAGAILRLQLDTALRFSAAWLVDDPHKFAIEVLGGSKIRNMRDRSGNKMTDAYLVSTLGKDFEWIPRVYERTSGYIHFSSVHIFSAISMKDQANRTIELKISEIDKELPDEIYIEAIDAFEAVTGVLLKYVGGWSFTKANPESVMEMRAKLERERRSPD